MSKKELSSQKMGEMPIGKLLFTMSAPAMLSMMVQALYNIVDSLFVAQISENALTAISLAFPMQAFVLSLALGVGIGANSLIARALGQGDRQKADLVAKNGLFLVAVVWVIIAVFSLFATEGYLALFSTESAEIGVMAKEYLQIVMVCSAFMLVEIYCNKILQSTGNMIVPMFSMLIGAITNIILDPIFIFGLFGVPAMGVAGAAIATIIGQGAAMAYCLTMFLTRSHDIHIGLKGFKPNGVIIKEIIKVGTPVFIMNSIVSITVSVLNGVLILFSETAVAVLGIYFKVQTFVFMPVFGLQQGVMPILGYNFGANNKKRFYRTFRLAITVACIIMVLGVILFNLFPVQIFTMFKGDENMISIGVPAFRILSLCFIPAAFGIMMSSTFLSIGYSIYSMIMSITRQLVFILPLSILFAKMVGINGIWFSYFVAEMLSLVIFFPIGISTIKKEFAKKELEGKKVQEN